MVRIDRVHTGGGDSGESSLVDGSRRSKSDARFSVVGDCDELNSLLGVARMECARVPMRHRDGGDRKGAGRVHFICDSALSREFNMNSLILEQNLLVLQKTFRISWFSSMMISQMS